eukprot:Hpha_TRINITY_DN919_c0_g1::TRINITY_DN919_c0_g1_i1::g.156200::m.156200
MGNSSGGGGSSSSSIKTPQQRPAKAPPKASAAICGGCGGDECTSQQKPPPDKVQWSSIEKPQEALKTAALGCRASTLAVREATEEGRRLVAMAREVLDLQREAGYCKDQRVKGDLMDKFERQTHELVAGLGELKRRTESSAVAHSQPGLEERLAEYSLALQAHGELSDEATRAELTAFEEDLRALNRMHTQSLSLLEDQQRILSDTVSNIMTANDHARSALTLWSQAKIAMRHRPTPLITDQQRDMAHSFGSFGKIGHMRN